MTVYRKLEPFFKSGTFYGLGETVHVHVHPVEDTAVINVFNLENHAETRHVDFTPARIGLKGSREYNVVGAKLNRNGDLYRLEVPVPALGHALVELR